MNNTYILNEEHCDDFQFKNIILLSDISDGNFISFPREISFLLIVLRILQA